MENAKRCPACGKQLDKVLERCPFCGLEGLNQIFISERDYLEWVRYELNPHKAKLTPRIFAGDAGALILKADGTLYGIGNNDTGSFGNGKMGEWLTEPQLIAENVKSAAAGYRYSIYLAKNGDVKLVGNTGIPYKSRFSGFHNVADVYASPECDAFWLLLTDGSLYAFGENANGLIESQKSEVLHCFPEEELTVEYRESLIVQRVARTDGPPYVVVGGDKSDSNQKKLLSDTELRLKMSADYQKCAEFYGSDNLEIQFELVNKNICSETSEEEKDYRDNYNYERRKRNIVRIQQETYQPKIVMENKYIFHPISVKEPQKYLPGLCYYGSGVAQCEQGLMTQSVRKISVFKIDNVWYQAVLKTDDTLQIQQSLRILAVIPDIADMAIGGRDAYVVTRGGRLLTGKAERLMDGNGLSAFESIQFP